MFHPAAVGFQYYRKKDRLYQYIYYNNIVNIQQLKHTFLQDRAYTSSSFKLKVLKFKKLTNYSGEYVFGRDLLHDIFFIVNQ